MRNFVKRILFLMMSLILILAVPVGVYAEDESEGQEYEEMAESDVAIDTLELSAGQCGDNLTWSVADGILTISGTGEMWDYANATQPWYGYKDNISTLVLEGGITSIGNYAFYGFSGLQGELVIPDSVIEFGTASFSGCSGFSGELKLPANITSVGISAFSGCSGFSGQLNLPGSIVNIEIAAFAGCSGLSGELVIPENVASVGSMAFCECTGFTGVLIMPESVSNIDSMAFYKCNGLENIVFTGNAPSLSSDLFTGLRGNIYYPAYKEGWEAIVSQYGEYTWISYEEGTKPWENVGGGIITGDTTVEGFVERMYTVVLNRAYDAVGKANWVYMLNVGTHNGAGIAKEFILGQEFKLRNLSNEEYINVLYRTFFNREPDETGKKVWLASLEIEKRTREYVLSSFVNSDEFTLICGIYGIERGTMFENGGVASPGLVQFIKTLYVNVLGKDADEGGLSTWAYKIIVEKETAGTVADYFFKSSEWTVKNVDTTTYVSLLYRIFMNREPDAVGLAAWATAIDRGEVTREQVLSEFSNSPEFKAVAAMYGFE